MSPACGLHVRGEHRSMLIRAEEAWMARRLVDVVAAVSVDLQEELCNGKAPPGPRRRVHARVLLGDDRAHATGSCVVCRGEVFHHTWCRAPSVACDSDPPSRHYGVSQSPKP